MEKVIIVQLSIQKAKIEAFLKYSEVMVQKSIAEDGCLAYKILNVLDKENEFFIYEKYENEKAVENHNSSEHLKNFMDLVTPFLSKKPIIEAF